MKKLLVPCAFALLAMGAPVLAADRPRIAASIGQPVYDSANMQVGVIRGETRETGEASAIVSTSPGAGNHEVLIAEQNLQPRTQGGWLAALDSNSIAQLQPYVPGHMPPA